MTKLSGFQQNAASYLADVMLDLPPHREVSFSELIASPESALKAMQINLVTVCVFHIFKPGLATARRLNHAK